MSFRPAKMDYTRKREDNSSYDPDYGYGVNWKNVYIAQKSKCDWAKRTFGECLQLNKNKLEFCKFFRDYMECYCPENQISEYQQYFIKYNPNIQKKIITYPKDEN